MFQMFKFELGQLVYYIHLNKLREAKIIARKYVDKIDTNFVIFNNDRLVNYMQLYMALLTKKTSFHQKKN